MLAQAPTTQLLSRLTLLRFPGIGRRTIRGMEQRLRKVSLSWSEFWVCDSAKIKKICETDYLYESCQKIKIDQLLRVNVDWLSTAAFWVVDESDQLYPPLLRITEDPPLVLFGIGNKHRLLDACIAVIGTRRMTAYGKHVARIITKQIATQGVTIVSGGMYGIDETAHRTTFGIGKTIAVLGFGLERVPEQTQKLCQQITESGGAVVTEYLPDTNPSKGTFPERNRIIAGMAAGTVVIEAAIKSGTHITVQCALDAGRSVFAVPGPITSPYSDGTAWLLRQGAIPITTGSDVIRESGLQNILSTQTELLPAVKPDHVQKQVARGAGQQIEKTDLSRVVRAAVQSGISQTDQLCSSLELPASKLLQLLTELEMNGEVNQVSGEWFYQSNNP